MSTSLLSCYALFWLTDHTDHTDLPQSGYQTTEVTDLTDFVSIACSLRHLPVTSPQPNTQTKIMQQLSQSCAVNMQCSQNKRVSTSLLGCYALFWLTDHTDSTDLPQRGYQTTEVTDLTDFVSIACSLRHLPVTSPQPNTQTKIMQQLSQSCRVSMQCSQNPLYPSPPWCDNTRLLIRVISAIREHNNIVTDKLQSEHAMLTKSVISVTSVVR